MCATELESASEHVWFASFTYQKLFIVLNCERESCVDTSILIMMNEPAKIYHIANSNTTAAAEPSHTHMHIAYVIGKNYARFEDLLLHRNKCARCVCVCEYVWLKEASVSWPSFTFVEHWRNGAAPLNAYSFPRKHTKYIKHIFSFCSAILEMGSC